jgi:hypothetical protein
MYYHKARGLRLSVHGDDVMCAGPLNQLRWMMSVLDKHFESKHKIMGEAKHLLKEVKILNRDAKWSKKGISLEADAKHVKTLLKEMKMEDAKAVKTPAVRPEGAEGSRDRAGDEDDEAEIDESEVPHKERTDSEVLAGEASRFRSWTARLNYLAMDRPDIQFAVKACAKAMASPKTEDFVRLERLLRYLKHRPNLKIEYEWQIWASTVTMLTDSDWAGDRIMRRSSSGDGMMMGAHALKTWSKDQSVTALSSGEAELYAANLGSCQALGP